MLAFERVWIVGAGAIGSALAAELSGAGGARVVLVGQSPHWEAVRARGLAVTVGDAPSRTLRIDTVRPTELPALGARDLILLTGKLQRLDATLTTLRPCIAPQTGVIALQNGLRVAELVAGRLGRAADRGLVIFGAHSPAPGEVRLFPGGIRFARSPVTEAACGLFAVTTLRCTLIDDLAAAEWRKLAINCLANPLAGLLGQRNARLGQAVLDPAKDAILAEVRAVAAAEGIALDFTVGDFNRYMAGPTGGNIASLRSDLLRGEPTEIDFLNGAVVRLGARQGVPTPVNALIVSLIKALETGSRPLQR